MDYSRLAFQGYLEKTGLSIPEAEYAAKNARFAFTSYLQQVAEMIQEKNDKIEAIEYIDDFKSVDGYDGFIFGAPTWNTGADSERSRTTFDSWLYDDFKKFDFEGKPGYNVKQRKCN